MNKGWERELIGEDAEMISIHTEERGMSAGEEIDRRREGRKKNLSYRPSRVKASCGRKNLGEVLERSGGLEAEKDL